MAIVAGCSCLFASASAAQQPSGSFQTLGYVNASARSPSSSATGISLDGSTVAGYGPDANGDGEAYIYAATQGWTPLSFLNPSKPWSTPTAISADGSIVVGGSYATAQYQTEAFMRTKAGGMQPLGYLNATLATPYSEALGVTVTAAGTTIIDGASNVTSASPEAFKWTAAGGMTGLGFLNSSISAPASVANGISSDGTKIVGYSLYSSAPLAYEGFVCTAAAGMQPLGFLSSTPATPYSQALAISADGSTIVGKSKDDNGHYEAVAWTSSTAAPTGLGYLNTGTTGTFFSSATGVDANGAVIIGASYTSSGVSTPFRWTAATGMASFPALLGAANVNLTGWTIRTLNGVSGDGQYFVGNATDSGGDAQAFLARYVDATVSPFGGITTAPSLIASIDEVGRERQTVMVQTDGFAAPLISDNDRIVEAGGAAGVYATVGSAAGGGAGRQNFGNGLTLFAGLGAAGESYANAEMKDAVIAALALRYVYDFNASAHAFGEFGGWFSPSGAYQFARSYANGAGTANGVGSTNGQQAYVFGRAGLAYDLTKADEAAVSAELGWRQLSTNGYVETLSPTDPFNASVADGADRMDVFKARAQWTHAFSPQIDATVWGAYAAGFNYSTSLVADVPGLGFLTPSTKAPQWGEFGLRVGYTCAPNIQLNAFLDGVAGGRFGTSVHSGGGVLVRF